MNGRFNGKNASYLCNNQINARVLIGQSAMVHCAGKPMEKTARLLDYYIKAIDHKFLWFYGRTLGKFVNHSPAARVFSCSTNIPRGLSAYKP